MGSGCGGDTAGHLALFAEHLTVSGRFDALVADSPLHDASSNTPSKRDILGTLMLWVPAGQRRYAHIAVLRDDGVNPALLGMTKVASEDSLRCGLERIGVEGSASCLHGMRAHRGRQDRSGAPALRASTLIPGLKAGRRCTMRSPCFSSRRARVARLK